VNQGTRKMQQCDTNIPKLIKKSPIHYKTQIFNKDPDTEPA